MVRLGGAMDPPFTPPPLPHPLVPPWPWRFRAVWVGNDQSREIP